MIESDSLIFKDLYFATNRFIQCRNCNRLFSTALEFEHHAYLHHGIRRYKCSDCGETFVTENQLYKHTLRHKNKTYDCDLCHARYNRKQDCQQHRTLHFINNQQETPDADGPKSEKLYVTIRSKGTTQHVCSVCHAVFPKLSSIVLHVRMHLPRRHLCKDCGLYFGTAGSLSQHRNTHNINKEISCDQCNLTFPNLGLLENHVRVAHNGMEPFRCISCLAEFRSLKVLTRHRLLNECTKPHAKILKPNPIESVRRRKADKTTRATKNKAIHVISRKMERVILRKQFSGSTCNKVILKGRTVSDDVNCTVKLDNKGDKGNKLSSKRNLHGIKKAQSDSDLPTLMRITRSMTRPFQLADKGRCCIRVTVPNPKPVSEKSCDGTPTSHSPTVQNTEIVRFAGMNYCEMDANSAVRESCYGCIHSFTGQTPNSNSPECIRPEEDYYNADSNNCFSSRYLSALTNFNVNTQRENEILTEEKPSISATYPEIEDSHTSSTLPIYLVSDISHSLLQSPKWKVSPEESTET